MVPLLVIEHSTVCTTWTSKPWTMAAFNLLARRGLEMDDENMVHLSIAELSLSETNTID